jgi:hypothetical protein
MRTILDKINDLLEMGVGYTTRLKRIKDDILANKPLWSADVQYVEELSRVYLQNKIKHSIQNDEKIIIIGTVLALGLFFVFFIVPFPDDNPTPEELTPLDSVPADVSPSPVEVSPNPEKSLSVNPEFSSANVIQSSSSTQT